MALHALRTAVPRPSMLDTPLGIFTRHISRRELVTSITNKRPHPISRLSSMSCHQNSTARVNPSRQFHHTCRRSTSSSQAPTVLVNDMDNQELVIEFADGQAVRYPSFWLRDNCLCTECSHPHTHQRQIDTFEIDPNIKVLSISAEPSGLQVKWSNQDHISQYPWSWLQDHSPFPTSSTTTRHQRMHEWQHISPQSPSYPTVDFTSVMSTASNEGLLDFIHKIHTYGLCFISNTPPTPSATEALLQRIAFIRVTHYGGFWDFTSEARPIDTAYTNLGLELHTDNSYFTDPAGLQLFHLLSHTGGVGGASTFADGFAAATSLYKSSPRLYNALSSIPVVFSAEGAPEGSFFNTNNSTMGNSVFTHHPGTKPIPQNLAQIRWNNSDRSARTVFPNHATMRTWYMAARAWSELLKSPDYEIDVQLQPGTPVIFDNWRILHGRGAFEGKRRMCGGYINMDDFRAKGRSLGIQM